MDFPSGGGTEVEGSNSLVIFAFTITLVNLFLTSHQCFAQVLVVRNDLKMGKGKIAAQCR